MSSDDQIGTFQDELISAKDKLAEVSNRFTLIIINVIAVVWSLFQIGTATLGTLAPLQQRGIHLLFALILTFLIHRTAKKGSWLNKLDHLFIAISVGVTGYVIIQSRHLMYTPGRYTTLEIWISGIALLIILEACRRATGISIPIASAVFLLYALLGHFMGPPFGHRFYPVERVVTFIYYTLEGIYGIALAVSTNYIYIFVLFGVLYTMAGGGELIIGLSSALMGHVRGGPAKIATVGSCLFGSISGVGAANVVATGSVTIPLMKRMGYRPRFAAAVEAAASSGGQIMPPIMGGAAFIMADILGVTYWRIVIAAILPSLLYYWAVFESVDFQAAKQNLSGMPKEMLPDSKKVIKNYWPLFIPIFFVLFFLGVLQRSPQRAGLLGVISTLIIMVIKQKGSLKERVIYFFDALAEGALKAAPVAIACATVGIIVGVIMMSGIGFKIGSILTSLAGGNMWILLIFAMITSLILGMGLPVTVSYLIVVFIVINPLIDFGIVPLVAHMFALFFAVMSNVTPPFAVAAVAAAGMAGSYPMKTGYLAFSMLIPSFVIAFSFVNRPELLFIGDNWSLVIIYFVSAGLGITCFAASRIGYLKTHLTWFERVGLLILAVPFLFGHRWWVLGISYICFFLFYLYHRYRTLRSTPVIK